jgi:hypothetical protein
VATGADLSPTLPRARRLISLLGTIALIVGLFRDWHTISTLSPAGAVLVVVGFGLSLALAVLALALPENVLHRLDVGVLALAVVLFIGEHLPSFKPHHTGSTDEARLGHGALNALLAGHNPYAVTIPEHAGTRLITGGVVTHYAYPPLTLELGWLAGQVSYRLAEPWVIAEIGVVATAVIAFLALPRAVRPLVIPVVFGFGLFDGYASNGFPMLVALPLLCLAAWNWTSIGKGGRLGWLGAGQAAALGLAASAQQLAWFVAALFVLALWVVRCGELSRWRATAVTGRFALVAAGAFAAVNLPFAVMNVHAWAAGITTVFTQQAVPFGAGLVLLTKAVFGQCDNLDYFTYATVLLAITLLAITLVGLRRIAVAVPVLASVVFLLSSRSDVEYFVAFVPLWVVWAATTDASAVAASRPLGLPRRFGPVLTSAPRRVAAVSLALLPTVLLAVDAVAGQGPLTMRADSLISAWTRPTELLVTVTNHSTSELAPTFSVGVPGNGHNWAVASGRLHLAPGQRRTVVLVPDGKPELARQNWRLSAFTADPSTLSSTSLHVLPRPRPPRRPGHVHRTPSGRQPHPTPGHPKKSRG